MNSDTMASGSFYGWKNVTVVSVFGFICMFALFFLSLCIPLWDKELGWSHQAMGWANTVFSIVMGLGHICAGIFVAKYGSRWAIVIGSFIVMGGFIILSFQSQLWHLYLGYGIIIGIGGSLASLMALTTIVNNWFVKRRSLALSIVMASSGLGGVFLIKLANWLNFNVGWRTTALIFCGVFFVCGVIIQGLFLRNKPEDLDQVPDGVVTSEPVEPEPVIENSASYSIVVDFTAKEAFQTLTLWLLMVYYILLMFCFQGLGTFTFDYFIEIGIPPVKASWIISIGPGVMVVGNLLVGFIGLRYNIHRLAIIGFIPVVLSVIILASFQSLFMIYIHAVLLGIGLGINMVAVINLLANYFGAKHYPKIFGYLAPGWSILAGLGAPVTGFIYDKTQNYGIAWQIFVVLLLIALVCLLFAKPPVHPSLKQGAEGVEGAPAGG